MEKALFSFFENEVDPQRPILVGLSGGPDSTCLLHLLLAWNKAKVHIVHVDHGWRKESKQELLEIQTLAKSLGLPLHVAHFDPVHYKGNLEAESRKERLQFFKNVAQDVGAQAIMLGHHADDQAETVLKRVLEGASLPFLGGMAPVSHIDSLIIMRPLLNITKKEIVAWLTSKNITYFSDPTNSDERFLRAKMRTTIFPNLRAQFGKAFEQNLCEIAHEAQELRAYLDAKCAPYLEKVISGPFGAMMPDFPQEALERTYILRKLKKVWSRTELRLALKLLAASSANKQLQEVYFDRGRVFFLNLETALGPSQKAQDFESESLGMGADHSQTVKAAPVPSDSGSKDCAFRPAPSAVSRFNEKLPELEGSRQLQEGHFHYGPWRVVVTKVAKPCPVNNSFIDVWKGHVSTLVPTGCYTIAPPDLHLRRKFADGSTKEFGRYVSEKKIPHFLVPHVPVLIQDNQIVQDFLTANPHSKTAHDYYFVTLDI